MLYVDRLDARIMNCLMTRWKELCCDMMGWRVFCFDRAITLTYALVRQRCAWFGFALSLFSRTQRSKVLCCARSDVLSSESD